MIEYVVKLAKGKNYFNIYVSTGGVVDVYGR